MIEPQPVHFNVNGQACASSRDLSSRAVYVLRNELGLRDVRLGCGEGDCGACTVLLDGRPTTTCDLPLSSLADVNVQTVSGLLNEGLPHPVQKAFIELQAGQCGFCLSGILMTAAHLYALEQRPTRAEVNAALDRHLCRCGAHTRMLKAIDVALDRKHSV